MGYVSFLEGNYRDLIWGTPSITENLRFGAKIFHTEGVGGLVLHGSRSPRVDEVPLKKIEVLEVRKSHEKNGDTAGFSNFWGLFQVIMANPVQKVSPDWSSKSRHFVGTGPIWKMGSCCVSFFQTNRSLRFHRVPNHDSYLLSWMIFLLSLQKFLLATSWGVSFCGEVPRWWIQTWLQGPAVLPQETLCQRVQTQEPLNKHFRFGGADWRVFFMAAHATLFFNNLLI